MENRYSLGLSSLSIPAAATPSSAPFLFVPRVLNIPLNSSSFVSLVSNSLFLDTPLLF